MAKDHKEKPTDSNPFFIKLAFPIALSLAGFLMSTLARRSRRRKQSREDEIMNYPDSEPQYDQFDEEELVADEEPLTCVQSLDDAREIAITQRHEGANPKDEGADMKDEIEGLKSLVACLEEREGALESQFYDYFKMKEQESAFQKLQIMCLGLKLESLESRNEELESNVEELKGVVVARFETIEGEIKLLQRRLRKILKATRVHGQLIRKQALNSQAKEELRRANKEIKEVADRAYKEKKDIEDKYSASMSEQRLAMDGMMSGLHDKELFDQLQQLRVQRSAEMEELIYLGWINWCLRRELIEEEEEEEEEEEGYVDGEGGGGGKPLHEVGDKVVMEIPADNKHVRNCSVESYGADVPSAVSDNGRTPMRSVAAKNHRLGSMRPRLLCKIKAWAKGKGKGTF